MANFIVRNIPNTITCLNLFSGCVASVMAFQHRYEEAIGFILLGAFFDYFDGMTARLLNVSGPLGKELDSLADDLIAVFSALRLGKFNIDTRQTSTFIGLPTPANAIFWGSLVVGAHSFLVSESFNAIYLLILVVVMSLMLVAEIPMFSLKFHNLAWKENKIRFLFLLVCIPLLIFFKISGFAAIIVWYILLSLITKKCSKA